MPGGETTSTNPGNDPLPGLLIGRVSAIFPGAQRFRGECSTSAAADAGHSATPVAPNNDAAIQPPRSRVCEIVWIDADLFGGIEPVVITAIAEGAYAEFSKESGSDVKPGMLGEQIVVRELRCAEVRAGQVLQIGDAKVRVLGADPRMLKLELIDEGLVEPGAPVIAITK